MTISSGSKSINIEMYSCKNSKYSGNSLPVLRDMLSTIQYVTICNVPVFDDLRAVDTLISFVLNHWHDEVAHVQILNAIDLLRWIVLLLTEADCLWIIEHWHAVQPKLSNCTTVQSQHWLQLLWLVHVPDAEHVHQGVKVLLLVWFLARSNKSFGCNVANSSTAWIEEIWKIDRVILNREINRGFDCIITNINWSLPQECKSVCNTQNQINKPSSNLWAKNSLI